MRQLSSQEVKQLELEMLLKFDEICKSNSLYYTLCGGTLLGAVRHKGFIPWDDDIDVLMPRPDFERLLEMVRSKSVALPEYMDIASWFTSPPVYVPFVKIIDKRTLVKEEFMSGDKHLWIDIFVTDACPDDEKIVRTIFNKSLFLRKLLFKKQTRAGSGKTKAKAVLKDILRVILSPISLVSICRAIENNAKKYDFASSSYIAGIQWGYGPQEKVSKRAWMAPIELEFEGHTFPAPSNYDEYLSNLYGDYMTLPPENKRISHDMLIYIKD